MTEVVAVVSTLVGIGLQLKDSIDRVRYNRETHSVIINRISDSLRRLKVEARKASAKSSPSLVRAIAKLKKELEHALERTQRESTTKNTSSIRQWFHRDTIESALKDVEKQIANCFQEFTALAAIRIERKLGVHNAQVNRKLDELLRQGSRHHTQLPVRPRSGTPDFTRGRAGAPGRAGTPSSSRLSDRSDTPVERGRGGSLDLPRPRVTSPFPKAALSTSSSTRTSTEDLTFKVHLPTRPSKSAVLKRKPPPAARSDTSVTVISMTSSVSSTSPSSPPSLESPVPTVAAGMTRPQTRPRILSHPVLNSGTTARRAATIPIPPSPTSPTFSPSRSIFPNAPNFSNPTLTTSFFPDRDHANLFSQANDYDTECRRLRSLKHTNEALTAARNAVRLRRSIICTIRDIKNVTALARSLTYMGRCLRDLYTDSKAEITVNKKGSFEAERIGQELTRVWTECAELYKEAFLQDKSLRTELATVLYNLSAKLSEPSLTGRVNHHGPMTSVTSLNNRDAALSRERAHELDLETALDAAEEAVHHFTVLERDEPETYTMDLANAQLNLSFILSDLGRHSKALTVARKGVILAYRLTSTDPHTQERVRIMRTLHKSLMRVSYCLRDLGKNREADEAEMEAKEALRKQFFVLGS
ncbi:hypothetical protein D9758_010788 [Tetrapyrgos nigripes]|uniref:Uncharacterized protein n=1 Tax=Tetrapyrgos nigripes TaxID=182062 RepID=A0A8H5D722_9AGAR|nr:hypothetical protein D9758_010788 [Tetrapyrgos nigripes]